VIPSASDTHSANIPVRRSAHHRLLSEDRSAVKRFSTSRVEQAGCSIFYLTVSAYSQPLLIVQALRWPCQEVSEGWRLGRWTVDLFQPLRRFWLQKTLTVSFPWPKVSTSIAMLSWQAFASPHIGWCSAAHTSGKGSGNDDWSSVQITSYGAVFIWYRAIGVECL